MVRIAVRVAKDVIDEEPIEHKFVEPPPCQDVPD